MNTVTTLWHFGVSLLIKRLSELLLSTDFNEIWAAVTAQKTKFSIKDFFVKCDQIRRKLWIWSHLLKKSSLMENFIFCDFYMNDSYIQKFVGDYVSSPNF